MLGCENHQTLDRWHPKPQQCAAVRTERCQRKASVRSASNFTVSAGLGGSNQQQLGLNHNIRLLIAWGWFYFITNRHVSWRWPLYYRVGRAIWHTPYLLLTVLVKLLFLPRIASKSYASWRI